MFFSLDNFLENNSLAFKLYNLLGEKLNYIYEQVEGLSSRVVELLNQVSLLPLFSFTFCQHANNQQNLSPAAYPFYAGDKK